MKHEANCNNHVRTKNHWSAKCFCEYERWETADALLISIRCNSLLIFQFYELMRARKCERERERETCTIRAYNANDIVVHFVTVSSFCKGHLQILFLRFVVHRTNLYLYMCIRMRYVINTIFILLTGFARKTIKTWEILVQIFLLQLQEFNLQSARNLPRARSSRTVGLFVVQRKTKDERKRRNGHSTD